MACWVQAYEAVLALLHSLVCAEASAPPLLRLLCMQGSLGPLLDTPTDIASSTRVSQRPSPHCACLKQAIFSQELTARLHLLHAQRLFWLGQLRAKLSMAVSGRC